MLGETACFVRIAPEREAVSSGDELEENEPNVPGDSVHPGESDGKGGGGLEGASIVIPLFIGINYWV